MRGLPARSYTDPAIAPAEFAAIFARSWQFVCHVADLPAAGTAARFDCGDRSAFVLRTRAGELNAFVNACSHRGSRLVDGDPSTGFAFCVDGRVRCPYHGWAYDETGVLESVPGPQAFDADELAALHLQRLPVAQWRGLVFVAFSRPERDIDQTFAGVSLQWPDVSAMRRLAEPRSWPVEADWKLTCEHLLDGAHLDVARPALKPRGFEAPSYTAIGPDVLHGVAPLADATRLSWPARSYVALVQRLATQAIHADTLFLWPNLLLCLAPDGLTLLQVMPQRSGTSAVRTYRYGAVDGTRETKALRYLHERVLRRALRDDQRMLERLQHGLRALDPSHCALIARGETALQWYAERYRSAIDPCSSTAAGLAPKRRRAPRRRPAIEEA